MRVYSADRLRLILGGKMLEGAPVSTRLPTRESYATLIQVRGLPRVILDQESISLSLIGPWSQVQREEASAALRKAKGWMDRIEYKDGFQFVLGLESDLGRLLIRFCVVLRTIDSMNLSCDVKVAFARHYTPTMIDGMDFAAFVNCVRDILKFIELHEMDEFLRVDGKLVCDPHAG